LNAEARTSIKLSTAFDNIYQAAVKGFLDDGGKLLEWDAGELEKLNALVKPLWVEWIAEQEARGIPAKKVVDAFYYGLQAEGFEHPALGYTP
jgi:hypothetical protein